MVLPSTTEDGKISRLSLTFLGQRVVVHVEIFIMTVTEYASLICMEIHRERAMMLINIAHPISAKSFWKRPEGRVLSTGINAAVVLYQTNTESTGLIRRGHRTFSPPV
jgi:hypothetical protein